MGRTWAKALPGKKNRTTDLAYYEALGTEALATFETTIDALHVAALGMSAAHVEMQRQIDALQVQQTAVLESQAKFSRAAVKLQALVD